MKNKLTQLLVVGIGFIFCAPHSIADQSVPGDNEGVLAIYQGDYEKAENYFLQKMRSGTDKNEPLIYLSRIYLYKGDTEKAIDHIEQAMKLEPNSAEEMILSGDIYGAHAQRSSMFTALKLAKKCISQYEAAIKKEPDNVEALVSAMQFYFGAPSFAGGSTEKGNEILTRLQTLSPEDANTYKIQQLEKEAKSDSAVALANELVQKGFVSAKNQYTVAHYYRDKKLYARALPLFESLSTLTETPKTRWYIHDSLLQQGEIMMINKDFNKAIELINQYKQKNKNSGDIHYFWSSWSLAKAYQAAGNQTKYDELVAQIKSEDYKRDKAFASEFEDVVNF